MKHPFPVSSVKTLEANFIMFRMNPKTKNNSILFVEGENDERFWKYYISEQCRIVFVVSFTENNKPSTGKQQVITNVSLLNKNKNISGYLGIIDDDFDTLLNIKNEDNIFATETHDLETLLLSSPLVFKKLLAEYGDSEAIDKFEKNIGKTTHQHLLELTLKFAEIEWLKRNIKSDLELKNIHPRNIINNQWNIDEEKLNTLTLNKGIDISSPESKRLLQDIKHINPWLLCNGHTMVDILSLGFDAQYGAILGKNKRATTENITSSIRLAIDKADLYQTQLCQAIINWQKDTPFRILV